MGTTIPIIQGLILKDKLLLSLGQKILYVLMLDNNKL